MGSEMCIRDRPSLVELALRERAAERGATVPASLPEGEISWTQLLSWWDRRAALPPGQRLTAGANHSAFVDARGRLLTCGTEVGGYTLTSGRLHDGRLGHGPGAGPESWTRILDYGACA